MRHSRALHLKDRQLILHRTLAGSQTLNSSYTQRGQ